MDKAIKCLYRMLCLFAIFIASAGFMTSTASAADVDWKTANPADLSAKITAVGEMYKTMKAEDQATIDAKIKELSETTGSGVITYAFYSANPSIQPDYDTLGSASATWSDYYASIAGINTLGLNCDSIVNKGSVSDAKSKLNEGLDTQYIQGDLGAATRTMAGFKRFIQTIVGIIAYGIILGMVLFTSMDLCYITMPVFREKTEQIAQSQSGNKAVTTTDKKTGETKVRWVTDEARFVVEQCSISEGKNPLFMYLKKRALAYVLVVLVIFILITGRINIITDMALNFVSGILDVIEELGA